MQKSLIWCLALLPALVACNSQDSPADPNQTRLESLSGSPLHLAGTWKGKGTIAVHQTQTGQPDTQQNGSCQEVTMTMSQTADTLILETLNFNCDLYWSSVGSYTMEIRGNELWSSDGQVGSITDQRAQVSIHHSSETQTFDLSLIDETTVRLKEADAYTGDQWSRTTDHDVVLTRSP